MMMMMMCYNSTFSLFRNFQYFSLFRNFQYFSNLLYISCQFIWGYDGIRFLNHEQEKRKTCAFSQNYGFLEHYSMLSQNSRNDDCLSFVKVVLGFLKTKNNPPILKILKIPRKLNGRIIVIKVSFNSLASKKTTIQFRTDIL